MQHHSTLSLLLHDDADSNELEHDYTEYTQEPANPKDKELYNIPLSYLCTVNSKVNNASIFSLLRMSFSK